jgi:PadR family transcriptional regulator PadR
MQKTHAMVHVALALIAEPYERHWGYELTKRAHVRPGVLYPLLRRMLEDGWLLDGWEDPVEASRRPPRRYYVLTDKGRRELAGALKAARADIRFADLFRWAEA